jgi:protein involved in sex pheromone biosynthesis
MKSKNDNNTNTNHNNNNSKSSFKKINPELASLPGETTFGSIKTDTHKFRKFKASLQKNNNNSTSNIKLNDNLTI